MRHQILWDFEIQIDNQMSVRKPVNKKKLKKTFYLVDFIVSADHGGKGKESEKINKYLMLPEN